MDYKNIYYSIINKRKIVPYNGYTERHHILPQSLGGKNTKDNLVDLNAKEHYICHLLLTKIYKEKTSEYYKMIKAFFLMKNCNGVGQKRIINSKSYIKLREAYSIAQSISQSGEKNSQYGKSKSIEEIEKIRRTLRIYNNSDSKDEEKLKFKRNNIKRKILSKKVETKKYRNFYILYNNVGWKEFQKITDYNKSHSNFVQLCKKYLSEFISQNRIKRGS